MSSPLVVMHVRHAARQLRRTPAFALAAVASLAIGIGANAAIFSVADALLLAPTPGVRDAGRLVDVGRTTDGQGFDTVSFPTYRDLAARSDLFDGLYALRVEPTALSLGAADGAERVFGEQVSASYFDVLGLVPAAGSFFRTAEETVGVPLRKVVLTHAFWTERYAADPGVVGREIRLNGDLFVIVGVAPRGFRGTTVLTPDLWVPITAHARGFFDDEALEGRQNHGFVMGGRLRPGVTVSQARAGLSTFAAQLADAHPESYRREGLTAAPMSRVPGEAGEFAGPFVSVLMGLVGLVLLVTCTNLAGLLLARATARRSEMAVRLAIGASRRSLVGMLLTETLLIFALGTLAALGVARVVATAIGGVIATLPVPIELDLGLDVRVLVFTVLLALVTGLLTGLAPALQSTSAELQGDLKSDASAPRRQRLRQVFVGAQLAFCLVLMVLGGLLWRALDTAAEIDPGMNVEAIQVVSADLGLGDYPAPERTAATDALRDRLASLPGVTAVGYSRHIPLEGSRIGLGGLRLPGQTDPATYIDADWAIVSPDYLDTLGIPLVAGRGFSGADRDGTPLVAIVNERFAATVWPGANPVGQVLENGMFRPGDQDGINRITVIGVARDAKYSWLGEAPTAFVYVPYAQYRPREVHFFVRHGGREVPAGFEALVRGVFKAFDPDLPVIRQAPFAQYAGLGLLPQRLAASLAGALAAVALLLGAVGVYGVTAYAVANRTREIGVRVALGADRGGVLRLVLRQALGLAAVGGAVGLLLALGLAQLIRSLLFGVSPADPWTLAGTVGLLLVVTLAASLGPARRAASVDPVRALRE